jgi:hypothetical protein
MTTNIGLRNALRAREGLGNNSGNSFIISKDSDRQPNHVGTFGSGSTIDPTIRSMIESKMRGPTIFDKKERKY